MISSKTTLELTKMKKASIIVALAHRAAQHFIRVGVTTSQIDQVVEDEILKHGATPSFKGLYGFPNATCISVNSITAHGLPSDYVLQDGDIVSIDIGACYHGYHGDSAWTYAVGNVSEEAKRLMEVGEAALFAGLQHAKAGNHLTDISHAIGEYVFAHGYTLPRDYAGHGIGTSVHEEPSVPNFGPANQGIVLEAGMTFAVEPIVLEGRPQTRLLEDGFSIETKDKKLAVHYEHTIVITDEGYEILTVLNKEELPTNG